MRVPNAFNASDAAAMRDVIWRALEEQGIRRNDVSTWRVGRPAHLQHLRSDPTFQAIGSARTLAAINAVLEDQRWPTPTHWGAFFLVFPSRGRDWCVPSGAWHIDADYIGRLAPPDGVKVHAMLNDMGPRCGGMFILSGSHRLVHRWFAQHPPAPNARAIHMRKSLQRHPYLGALWADGDAASRTERFFDSHEVVDGIALQVVENTAAAGDVILMHPLLLHAPPAAHTGDQPRFLLNLDIRVRD